MADTQLNVRIPSVMEDPGLLPIARTYATSYLDAASETNVAEAVEELVSFVKDGFTAVPELRTVLTSGGASLEETIKFIDASLAPRTSPLLANFLRVLARHGRLEALEMISDQAQRMLEHRSGQRRVQVTTAVPVSDELAAALRQELQTKFGFEPIVEFQLRPELLGGMTLRVGDTVYDGSLKARVQQLRSRLRERCLHEIQRGRDRFSSPEGN